MANVDRPDTARKAGVIALASGFTFFGFTGLACAACFIPLFSAWGLGAVANHWSVVPTWAVLFFSVIATTGWFLWQRRRQAKLACGPECAPARSATLVEPIGATDKPIACDLTVFDKARREEHTGQFFKVVLGMAKTSRELPDGFAFAYPSDPAFFVRMAEWITNERKCCPFFTFELALEPDGGNLWLRMRGPDGTKEMMKSSLAAMAPSLSLVSPPNAAPPTA
jgi:hypothetical protein